MNAPFARDYSRFLGKAAEDATCVLTQLFCAVKEAKGEHPAISLDQYAILLMLYAAKMRHSRDLVVASVLRSMPHRNPVTLYKIIQELEDAGYVIISDTRRRMELTEHGTDFIQSFVYTLMWGCKLGGDYEKSRSSDSMPWLRV